MPYKVTERLFRSSDGRKVVLDGDVRARILIATPGDELPEKPTIEKLDTGQPEKKAIKSGENKALKPGDDKGGKEPNLLENDPAKRAETLDQSEDRKDGE